MCSKTHLFIRQLIWDPRMRNRFGDRSFSVAVPRLWNALPSTLQWQTDASFDCFKRLL